MSTKKNEYRDQRVTVLLDPQTRAALDKRRKQVQEQTGVYPSLSEMAAGLIRRELTQ